MRIEADEQTLEWITKQGDANIHQWTPGMISDRKIHSVPTPTLPSANPVDVKSISSFARMIIANVDEIDRSKTLVCCDHAWVDWVTALDQHRNRECIARARYTAHWEPYNWQPHLRFLRRVEKFVEDSPERKRLLGLVSTIDVVDCEIRTKKGAGYEVKTVSSIGEGFEAVDTPFKLRGMRTFPEVEQVEVPYICEIDKEGPQFRLVTADGNLWKHEAASRVAAKVREYFEEAGADPADLPHILF